MNILNFWGDVFKSKKEPKLTDFLSTMLLFKGLTESQLIQLSTYLHQRRFQKDEFVFQKNEPGESLYIVSKGSVSISDQISSDKTYIESPSFFGELSLVDENPRVVTAVATENTELLVFFRSDLLKIKEDNPNIAAVILYNLAFVLGKRLSLIYSEYVH